MLHFVDCVPNSSTHSIHAPTRHLGFVLRACCGLAVWPAPDDVLLIANQIATASPRRLFGGLACNAAYYQILALLACGKASNCRPRFLEPYPIPICFFKPVSVHRTVVAVARGSLQLWWSAESATRRPKFRCWRIHCATTHACTLGCMDC